jgi:hypothetical protein
MSTKKPTLDEKLAAAKARGKKVVAKAAPAKQLMLELWPEEVRGVPNAALRTAMFTAGKERVFHKEWTPIASVQGIEISARGERLNQHDLDLWEQLLHLQRLQPLGSRIEFTAHAMLRTLGRPTGGSAHARLHNDLGRLLTSAIEVRWTATRRAFGGNLVSSYFRDEDTDRYVVSFNADTLNLYADGYTWIDPAERKSLGRNLIAKALHGLYTSHAKPYPYSVDMLWKLCAGSTKRNEFRRLLRVALDKLKEIGVINSWEIDEGDLVHVKRTPSQSQRKHLAQRSKK